MAMFDRILRSGEGKKLKALQSLTPDIGALEPELQRLSNDELKAKTGEFRQRLDNGEDLDDLLIEAFAVVREAGVRVLGQRHYDVQLIGGAALHFGWIAEMKTGEGKTLVSTLPAYLNGLAGHGSHLITVNDYLARRDSEWMGRLHRWLGLNVGLIIPGDFDAVHKKQQYAADITYGTNNEFGFDYLRDNMAMSRDRQVQRGHKYAIVDEVDSILIDEARTPLIISGRVADAAQLYYKFATIVRGLRRDEDYEVDEQKRTVSPTEDGIEKVERALGIENLYDGVAQNLVHQLQAALRAKELFKRDKDYIIAGGEVKIVDEFTGRILEGRRWSEGLHQAVEAKEGVKIKEENQTLATVTLQNYFRMYDKLAGMTGTALTEAAEFANTYDLQVVPVPTNRPVARLDQGDLIYKSEDAKFQAVVEDIAERHALGQPVLIGTISVAKSERLSRELDKRGIGHEVLNAKQHAREADIVAQAGRLHAVTVATNMAGRGVDILLGGNPEGLARLDLRAQGVDLDTPQGQDQLEALTVVHRQATEAEGKKIRELGGLYVLGTERHESRRIDNQLRGRSGRQGDPGESRFYLSLEDDLMRLFATGAINWVMGKALPDDMPLEARMVSKAIERAQTTVEQKNAEIRKNVLKYDEVLNEQRKVIYALRDQILDKADLRERILTEHLPAAVETLVETYCVAEYHDEWDITGLHADMLTYWPSGISVEDLSETRDRKELTDLLVADGVAHYEAREQELGAAVLRQVERQVMLRIIDTRWREHLYEMDYLQEGINLRAMGQRDPLTEWQREGYEMFGQMMQGIAQDLVRYVMHVQVQVSEPAKAQAEALAAAEAEKARLAEEERQRLAELADAPKVPLWSEDATPPEADAPVAAATATAVDGAEAEAPAEPAEADAATDGEAAAEEGGGRRRRRRKARRGAMDEAAAATTADAATTDGEAAGDGEAAADADAEPDAEADEPAKDEAAADHEAAPDEAAAADEAVTDEAPEIEPADVEAADAPTEDAAAPSDDETTPPEADAESEAEPDAAAASDVTEAEPDEPADDVTVTAVIAGEDAEVQILGYSMPDDPSAGGGMAAAARADAGSPGAGAATATEPATMEPVVKGDWEKTPRNAPCPCGSGKKYKRCHGNAA
jgi:preprotein translocase subunit SecA